MERSGGVPDVIQEGHFRDQMWDKYRPSLSFVSSGSLFPPAQMDSQALRARPRKTLTRVDLTKPVKVTFNPRK